jgi:hypothetical protein
MAARVDVILPLYERRRTVHSDRPIGRYRSDLDTHGCTSGGKNSERCPDGAIAG